MGSRGEQLSSTGSAFTRRPRCVDLFCGAGGSSWGAKAAGVEVVAGLDSWPLAGMVYQDNFPGTHFLEGRVEDLNPGLIARRLGPIDLILASPECTNHSPAKGSRPRCEKSKATAFHVVRYARALKPRWIVVENVVSMRRWSRYAAFKCQLLELGYFLREQVLNSADFGVPQSRRRLFILCDREQVPSHIPALTSKTHATARQVVNLDGMYRWSPLITPRRARATVERAHRARAVIGHRGPFLLVYYGSDHSGGWQRLSVPLRTVTTLDRFAVVKRERGVDVMRMLQVPELQAAMGMERMKFEYGTRRDRVKMIGNAVCPPVMCAVIRHLTGDSTW